jgi:hypothetical protein
MLLETLALAACAAQPGGTASLTTGGSPAAGAPAAAGGSSDAARGATAAPHASGLGGLPTSARPATPTAAPWLFTADLARQCVVPGGSQTLTAHSRPGYSVAFDSTYADGREGPQYGGYGVLPTNANGVATSSWTVAATAPAGQVRLDIGTSNGGPGVTITRTFTVAGRC